ncbi:XRE family transcriptional regulator [Actinosynnema sp. NPDC020468]|uniref:XRE family transcriptional regulator n=1 Tax=Actinosynnema sp. NPDC020468 TaxID=3154488 RepID=UPI0034096E52
MSSEGDAAPARPFADALRSAIAARGIGLERIREHLAEHGVSVSLATLSYWQSGRSRPERRSSLAAIGHLEAILDLPPGHLAGLLGPPRPRGRWLKRLPEEPRPVPSWDDRISRLSQQDVVTIGRDRGEVSFRSRHVLRAEEDGADRWLVVAHVDRTPPTITPLRHCALGRVLPRPEVGLVVAELLFDRVLRRGESIVIEHELVNADPHPIATNYGRRFRLPVREYVLEVQFDPAATPVACRRYSHTDTRGDLSTPVLLGPGGSLLGVFLDFGPGEAGFRWSWP